MKYSRFVLVAVLAAGLFALTAPTIAAPPESPAKGDVDKFIQAIQEAPDPSSTVAAYADAYAANPNDVRVTKAYITRMVVLGLPGMAYQQALSVTKADPKDGLAWGVMAYVDARRDRMSQAFDEIIKATSLSPRSRLVQRTAGELLAWYDVKKPKDLQSYKGSLDDVRNALKDQQAFDDAYKLAHRSLSNQEASSGDVTPPGGIQPTGSDEGSAYAGDTVYADDATTTSANDNGDQGYVQSSEAPNVYVYSDTYVEPSPYVYSDYQPLYYSTPYYGGYYGPGWGSSWWWPSGFFLGAAFFGDSDDFFFHHHGDEFFEHNHGDFHNGHWGHFSHDNWNRNFHGNSGSAFHGDSFRGGSHSGSAFHGSSGNAFRGSSGSAVRGSRGTAYRGSSGSAYRGSSGTAYRGSSGSAFRGSSGSAYRGSRGTAYRGSSGSAYRGGSGSVYRGSRGTAYRGSSGSAYRGSSGSVYRGSRGTAYRGSSGSAYRGSSGSAFRGSSGGFRSGGGGHMGGFHSGGGGHMGGGGHR